MQQVKIFKSIESELENLEENINSWIAEQSVNVVQIFGNIAPQSTSASGMGSFSSSDVLVIVVYES